MNVGVKRFADRFLAPTGHPGLPPALLYAAYLEWCFKHFYEGAIGAADFYRLLADLGLAYALFKHPELHEVAHLMRAAQRRVEVGALTAGVDPRKFLGDLPLQFDRISRG